MVNAADSSEQIAIVGMACRFPGGIDSPDSLWRFVIDGRHVSSKFPPDRSMTELADMAPPEVLASMAPMGGFIENPGEFDPEFFGISPREAKAMDPQQRVILEVTWEALERAGIDPSGLHGSDTGVYVGAMSGDYAYLIPGQKDLDPGYVAMGVSQSVLSGRISYVLGLQGPTMSVDTACSSSLVAMHLAAGALHAGECSLALAGGVSIMSTLTGFFALGQHGAISKEGRSKPYSADADGFCMSEGAAVLVLERLSDARRNGHPVLALFRGASVNQDGASKGLTVPSGPAQEKLIAAALRNAGLAAGDVDVVEGHGTGTPVGDPIELEALMHTYGAGRDADMPVLLGSIKSNFGHTQAAAGAAGVIKMVLAMQHGQVPATLHVSEPTPSVDWSSGVVEVVTGNRSWPDRGQPRRAGVSSFGISGTNSHVIIEQAPPVSPGTPTAQAVADYPEVTVWPLSAKTPTGLAAQAARLREHVQANPELALADVGHSLANARTMFDERAAVVGTSRDELIAGLTALADEQVIGPVRGRASDRKVVFVFPGQGAQFVGMGAQLMTESPVFAAQIRACEEAFAEFVDWSLTDVLNQVEGAPTLDRVDVVQPALFATMVSLAALWRSLGVTPDAVLGHSQGEVAAAYVAGALTLSDAARIATLRGLALRGVAGLGGMVSVSAPASQVRELLAGFDDVHIAATNSPSTTVVAGAAEQITQFLQACEGADVRARQVAVDYAAHSPQVDVLRADIVAAVASVTARSCDTAFFSTVTGDLLDGAELGPDYWYRNLREPVSFDDGFQAAFQSGYSAFLEMSVNPVLTAAMHESLEQDGSYGEYCVVVGSLKRDDAGMRRFLTSVAEAHVRGVSPDWSTLYAAPTAPVALPTYPFQRQTYWLTAVPNAGGGKPSGLGLVDAGHPLLGAMTELPAADRFQFSTRLALATHGWLADHALNGSVLLPGAMLLELALHAGDKLGTPRVEKLSMYTPVTLPETGAIQLQVVVGERKSPGVRTVAIYSRPEDENAPIDENLWSLHADGVLTAPRAEEVDTQGFDIWPPIGAEPAADPATAYQTLAVLGYQYGPSFQGMQAVWRRGDDVFAEVALPAGVADADKFGLHPALLDAAMQAGAAAAALMPSEAGAIRLPFAWESVTLRAVGATALRVRLTPAGTDRLRWILADGNAHILATGTLQVRSISMGKLAERGMSGRQDSLFNVEWMALPAERVRHAVRPGQWVVLGDHGSTQAMDGVTAYEDLTALCAAIDAGAPTPAVAVLPGLVRSVGTEPGAHVGDSLGDELAALLTHLQTWLSEERVTTTKLVFLTRGVLAADVGEDVPDVVGSAAWALVRSAQSEYQGRIVQIDFDDTEPTQDLLAAALQTDEPEIAVRRGGHFGRRLRSAADAAAKRGALLPGPWRLDIPATGNLDDAGLIETSEAAADLAPGMVRIALRAAGLSFPVALTGLATDGGRPARLVHEGAGVVLAVASDVTTINVGERVFGLFDDIASTVVANARLLARCPNGWSLAQAAATPIAYLTAQHALETAGLTAGETVLVHAATGGVGTAAVNLARRAGASVRATASQGKWDVLRGMGFAEDHIADSRSATFAEKFDGVDVVLNLLPDSLTAPSLGLLADGGRFVEIGRDAVREPDRVADEHPGVIYSSFELGALDTDVLGDRLATLSELFAQGQLPPLPLTRFDIRHAAAALRHLGEAKHTGKVVLTWPRTFDPNSTVLITGGTGPIGAIMARHMVSTHGAKHLLLASRSGAAAAGIGELVAELTLAGAEVTVVACDVSDRDALSAVLGSVSAAHPVGAVIHLAATLADATFAALTLEQLHAVLPSKALGGWHLHELTKHLDLSMFALFSSAAGTFGSPGQANYAAANVFLEAIAHHRYYQGLPATSIAWGWWAEDTSNTGSLDDADRARLSRMGLTPMQTGEALQLFDASLATGLPHVVPVGMDLALLRAASSIAELPTFFRALLHTRPRATQQMGDASQLAKRLAGLSPTQQHAVVVEMITLPISMVLGYSTPSAVQPDREFMEMGIDSLSSIELGTHLRALTGVKLANSVIFQFPTVNLLARHILDQITPEDAELADPIVAEVEMLIDRLAALHDGKSMPEELRERLAGSMRKLDGGLVAVEEAAR